MIVGIVVFRLAHGLSARLLADRFGVGASTIRKYVDLVVGVLSDEHKFFARYISIPHGPRLQHIIDRF
jgi:predicted DNA-binding transcriptional regulator YafY